MYDYSENDIPPSDDVQIVERLQINIVSRTRTRPFYINPNHSSYTRSMKEFLTKSFSIDDSISSDCCHKNCLKSIDYMYSLQKRNNYLSMNKSMKNSYLVGCMISTKTRYDYRIGNILLCRRLSKKSTQLVIFVYQGSKHDWKNILHFIQRYIMDKRLAH